MELGAPSVLWTRYPGNFETKKLLSYFFFKVNRLMENFATSGTKMIETVFSGRKNLRINIYIYIFHWHWKSPWNVQNYQFYQLLTLRVLSTALNLIMFLILGCCCSLGLYFIFNFILWLIRVPPFWTQNSWITSTVFVICYSCIKTEVSLLKRITYLSKDFVD